jgi:NAD(P)-dependent dehydrogenase (short-subunit alcohol dehydrogenase family)
MDLGLKNKNALIAGDSQDIGLAIAKALAAEGCNIAIGARGRERLDQAVTELSKFGVKAVPIVVDFMTEEGCRKFVDGAVAALGGCDILVNNVGFLVPGTLESLTQEQWKEVIDRNLVSYIHTTKFAIPHLKESTAGRVLNISGISGTMLFPGAVSTTLSNAAIIGFNKLTANDLAPFNILVNNLCPGIVDIESWGPCAEQMAKVLGKTVEEVRGALSRMSMLNRLGRPEEMGWVAAFLVSEKNSYMTATTVECCGGATKYI